MAYRLPVERLTPRENTPPTRRETHAKREHTAYPQRDSRQERTHRLPVERLTPRENTPPTRRETHAKREHTAYPQRDSRQERTHRLPAERLTPSDVIMLLIFPTGCRFLRIQLCKYSRPNLLCDIISLHEALAFYFCS